MRAVASSVDPSTAGAKAAHASESFAGFIGLGDSSRYIKNENE